MKRLFGLVLIAGGVLILLANFKVFQINDFTNLINYLWPSALVLLGLASMIEHRRITVWGTFLLIIGGVYLAHAFGYLMGNDPQFMILPAIVIALGLALLFGRRVPEIRFPKEPIHINLGRDTNPRNESAKKTYTAFLGGLDERVVDDAFTTCEVTAMLGAADMDFRSIRFAGNEGTLTLNAVFGGIECLLPKDVRVVATGTPMLGGFENRCVDDPTASKTLYVSYSAMFGSIEIRN